MLVLESIATETEVDFREGRRLHRSFSSLQSLFDLCAALDPHQNLVGGEDGHALYDLPDGVFFPFCDRGCGALCGLLRLLHAGADAVCVGAALQDRFLLFFECSLLGQDLRELCIAGILIFGVYGLGQQALELIIELRQPPFDIGKAQGLTLHRQKLYGNCVLDKVEQGRFVAHDGVDGCQNRRLQRLFLDRRGIVAVFCAVVQAAGTAPDRIFSAKGCSCAAAIKRPALTAHEPV